VVLRTRVIPIVAVAALALAFQAPEGTPPGHAPADEARFRQAALLRGRAQADMEDANYGRAVESLTALASLLPDNILPPVNLAICHFRLNQPEEAMAAVRRAQALDPDNAQMLYTLVLILRDQPDSQEEWRRVLDHFAETSPRDPRPHYLRAEEEARQRDWTSALESFGQASRRDPENLMLLAEQLVAAAEARNLDATGDTLDAIEDRLNGFDGNLADFGDQLRDLIDQEEAEALRPPALVLRNLLRPTDLYQLGLVPLTGGQQIGGPLFPQLDFDPPLPKSIQGGQDIEVAFQDVTKEWGSQGHDEAPLTLLAPSTDTVELLQIGGQEWTQRSLATDPATSRTQRIDLHGIKAALFQDLDQDTVSDLLGLNDEGSLWLFPGQEDGELGPGAQVYRTDVCPGAKRLFPLDIDHDGDLDLFVTCSSAADLYLQNNGEGTWSDQTRELGFGDNISGSTDLASADFDDDGDLDLLTTRSDSTPRLYLNRRAGPLLESGAAWGLDQVRTPTLGVRAADFNNDGLFDLLFWGESGGEIYLNGGDRFTPASVPDLPGDSWQSVAIGDFDNDGDQDGVIALAEPDRLMLLRNRRSSFAVEAIADLPAAPVAGLLHGDFDADGDLDIGAQLATESGAMAFWRNEGGNRNQWLGLRLVGRNDNNSKNNTQGLFTRLEVRIGDAYQVSIGNGGINHLGLGAARQADIIRVVWTNGLAQSWLRVAANRTLVEEQVLKGSCPFLYTWDGEKFQFVTDLMWRSPLGMILPDGSPAPHQSARDYVLIRGEQLIPTAGDLWLQITEELWESVYTDHLELMAVDHPEPLELVVDEAFRPPPHPRQPPVHWVDRRLAPTAAVDQDGRDVLGLVSERDEKYVDELPLSRFQGLTRGHHLEMTFEQVPPGDRIRLLLWGWIFPTDTTINFALHQNAERQSRPPTLEILDSQGTWATLEPFLGFPNGKRKAVVVDLGTRLPSGTVRLRIPTNMQIYWDAVALAVGDPEEQARWTLLEPTVADLHYRGYSQMYRHSASGPHLFDYDRVQTGPRFRDLAGNYTRFGPVETLLAEADDRYVIMNAGDEMTVRFDARSLPPLPSGWRRDWILFTDGWVKDGDIHTVYSQTVAPLPYHGMSSYPETPVHAYPDTDAHREYLEQFQTRSVTDQPFRTLLLSPADQ